VCVREMLCAFHACGMWLRAGLFASVWLCCLEPTVNVDVDVDVDVAVPMFVGQDNSNIDIASAPGVMCRLIPLPLPSDCYNMHGNCSGPRAIKDGGQGEGVKGEKEMASAAALPLQSPTRWYERDQTGTPH
jgi:hypothetical protein